MGTHNQLNRSFRHTQQTFDQLLQQYISYGFKKQHILKAWQQCGFDNSAFHDELIRVTQQDNAQYMTSDELTNSQFVLKKQLQQMEDDDLKKAIQLSIDQKNQNQQVPYRKDKQIPIGLKNLGNTCYMNAMLQGFARIEPFKELIFSLEFKEKTTPASIFLLRLQELIILLQEGDTEYLSPGCFFEALQKFKPNAMLVKGIQNDYNELQNAFLDAIEEALKNIGEEEKQQKLCQIFYGKSSETFSYTENESEVYKVKDTTFGSITIEASDCDLNKGFANTKFYVIDEYLTDNKEKTKADIEQFIKEPPKIQSFYINRVFYDPKQKQVCKNNSQFSFPIQFNMNEFKGRDPEEMKILKQLRKCGDSNENLDAFDSVIKLFKRSEGQIGEVLVCDDFNFCDVTTNNPNMIGSNKMLEQLLLYKQAFINRRELLQTQYNMQIDKKKQQLIDNKDIYILTSVLMHDGGANSGHYYCYVLDKQDKKTWWKCNDQTVTKVTFQEVQKDAQGQNRIQCNVSGLIYEQQTYIGIAQQYTSKELLTKIGRHQDSNIKQAKEILQTRIPIIKQNIQNIQLPQFKQTGDLEREFEKFSNYSLYLLSIEPAFCESYCIMEMIKQDYNQISNQLFGLNLQNEFIQLFNTSFPEIPEFMSQKLKQDFTQINSIIQQLPLSNIKTDNYIQSIQVYKQSLNILNSINSAKNIVQLIKQIYQALLLKGCFFIDLSNQTQSFQLSIAINQVLREHIKDNKFLDILIQQQIESNLNQSLEQVKLLTKRNEIIEQMKKANQQQQQQQQVLKLNLECKIVTPFIDQIKKLKQNELKLWTEFYQTIQTNKTILQQSDRQNQESILYFGQ